MATKKNDDDIVKEVWKPIVDYEGYYEISSFGRVKSVRRVIEHPSLVNGAKYKTIPERIRKPNIMKGYHCIALIKDKVTKVFRIHRLVMEHFGEAQPSEEHQVNHIDGNKSNNHIDNLEWVTPKENTLHAIKNGLRHNPNEETKKKMGEASKRMWRNPGYRKFQSEMAKSMWADKETHDKRSLAIKRGIAKAKEERNNGNG